MSLAAHAAWRHRFQAKVDKKTFRLADSKNPRHAENVDLSILQDAPEAGGSSAEHAGWVVDVRYTNAPDVILFSQNYVDEATARKVMDDLAVVAGEVEGFLRQEKFDKAAEKTKEFMDKMAANSGQTPVAPTEQ